MGARPGSFELDGCAVLILKHIFFSIFFFADLAHRACWLFWVGIRLIPGTVLQMGMVGYANLKSVWLQPCVNMAVFIYITVYG